jgi:type IV pilus assembly protein PilQ
MRTLSDHIHCFYFYYRKCFPAVILICLILSNTSYVSGQNKVVDKFPLDTLSKNIPALDVLVDLTVGSVPIQEFLRGLANQTGLNINIDPSMNFTLSNNFSRVRVKDVLQFLTDNFDLEIKVIGNILDVKKHIVEVDPKSRMKFESEPGSDLVSISASQVPIRIVATEISERTGQNIVVTPNLNDLIISCYIQKAPLESAIKMIALGNNFTARKTDEGIFVFEPVKIIHAPTEQISTTGSQQISRRIPSGTPNIRIISKDTVWIDAQNCRLEDIINILFPLLNKQYNLLTTIDDVISLRYDRISFDELLKELFAGTSVSCKFQSGGYRIGKRSTIDLEEVVLVQLKYRAIDSIVYIIPKQLKKDVEIKEYPDMNSLVISGASDRVHNVEAFVHSVDVRIPVVLIEVLIVDNKNSKALSTGITQGLSDKSTTTTGKIFPSVDMTLGASAVNEIIDGLNGFGWINLGKVKPNFYMTLKALEQDGIIELKSTPLLSTLNGHKARMSIGNTEYYKEELNNIFGSVTTQSQVITTYKPVDAELSVSIRPIVDGNEEVTLEIKVEQSDFTERISEFAPPGKVSRKFESLIRIKDQEMILLGGLEEKEVKDTRSGVPLLSRIPVIKWLFASHEKSNTKSKLNIFIKPTIIN